MGEITLQNIADAFGFLAALCGSALAIVAGVKKAVKKLLKPLFVRIDESDLNSCKNFLVQALSSAERGEALTEIEKIRLAEQFEYYTKKGGNSYIKEWHNRLQAQGKL